MLRGTNPDLRLVKGMLCAALALGGLTSTASPQWTVINLHPAGATESKAYGVEGGVQAGEATLGGAPHASLWSGSAESWVDLNPAGALRSRAIGAGGGQQAGLAWVPTYAHAGFWSGTGATWVDLNPSQTGAIQSEAMDAAAGLQVGGTWLPIDPTYPRASLWAGSADSWVNLNPPLGSWSRANATDGVQQVGRARVDNVTRAVLWTGTAESWVSLHPGGASSSEALEVEGGQQVGYAYVGNYRASLWNGTADSWVNLNPEGSVASQAFSVHQGWQAGYAMNGACIWHGSAASWTDLSGYLPAELVGSEAHGIWHDASNTYVAGFAYNTSTSRYEALLWIGPLPASGVDSSAPATSIQFGPLGPNPFTETVRLAYSVPAVGNVRIDVLDSMGRRLETLVDRSPAAASGQILWNAAGRPSGVYFCRMQAAGVQRTAKLILIK